MKIHRIVQALVTATATVGLGVVPAVTASSAVAATTGTTIPLVRVGTEEPISTLDPAKWVYFDSSGVITDLSLEGLLMTGPQGQLEPDLATSWAQTSPVTYVYHIRQGVKFWDGNEMTAADAAFSWNTCRNSGTGEAFAFASVKSIVASGPWTVVVTLKQPDTTWQYEPAYVCGVFEKSFYEAHKATYGGPGALIMGTGPWIVDSFDPTSGATLSANPNWWRGSVPVQRVTVSFFSSETSMALAMRAGEIDYALVASPKSFAATSGAPIVSTPSLSGANLSISTIQPGWNDVDVRQAVAYALNRSDIIKAAGGYGTPWTTQISAASLGTIGSAAQVNSIFSSINQYPYNLAKAKQEMALSAYPHGFSTTLLEFNYGDYIDCSEVIVAELAKIGITAQVKVVPTNAWSVTEFGAPSGRLTTFAGIGEINNDPAQWVDYSLGSWNAKSGGQNISEWDPPEVDTLVKDGIATSDNAKRFAIYAQILRLMQDDLPYIPLCFSDETVALSSRFALPGYTSYEADDTPNVPYAMFIKEAS